MKISIVEESDGVRQKLEHSLASAGGRHQFTHYASGEEAVNAVWRQPQPDVVLVNCHLPTMDGFECARKLRAHNPGLPVLMYAASWQAENINGHTTDELIFSAAHAGANGYLPKNLGAGEMIKAIKQVSTGARRRRRVFVTFFESEPALYQMARHWEKIATLIDAPSMGVARGRPWRTVTFTGKKEKARPLDKTPLIYLKDDLFSSHWNRAVFSR